METQTKTTWRKVKLGEAVDIIDGDRGRNYPGKDELLGSGYCVFLDAKNVSGTKFDFNNAKFISERKNNLMRKGQLQRNDFVLTTRGTVGNVAYYNENIPHDCMRINSGMVILRPKREVITDNFFYSFLISRDFRNQVELLKTGSAQPQLPIRDLKLFEVDLPPITDQKRIADILSAFDDKIELNNKISKNLEATAKAIFKEWFVNFRFPGHEKVKMVDSELRKIPERWKVKTLGDVADVQWGDTSVTKASYVEKGYPAYSASGQDGFRKTYDFDRIGIVLSAIGANCGITWLARSKWSVIKNTIRFWSTDEKVSTEYLFLATMRQESWPQRGSAQPFITMGDARKRKILVPAENILRQFNNFVAGTYLKIDFARLENQKLAALRDLLLPKLMSREIKV